MRYRGTMQEFVRWFFSPEVTDEAALRRGLASIPQGQAWDFFRLIAEGMRGDRFSVRSVARQALWPSLGELDQAAEHARMLRWKAGLIAEEEGWRTHEPRRVA